MNRRAWQRGVALAYLLWMLAGLALLVSGLVTLSLGDVRSTGLLRDRAQVRAAGMGAAHLLLRDRMDEQAAGVRETAGGENSGGSTVFTRGYEFGGYRITGRVIPLNGLLSLNSAPAGLLSDLFQFVGGMDQGDAAVLADRVVAWRSGEFPDSDEAMRFLVVEDLLRVPGMSRTVYDRIHGLVHTEDGGAAGVDPTAAPPGVLLVLARGDETQVEDALGKSRNPGETLAADFPDLYQASGGGGVEFVDLDITMPDGKVFRQRIVVDTSSRTGSAPWRFKRIYPVEAVGER